MESPVVSVVMSVFNGEQFLTEAVQSILDQSFASFEFIIINDGSTDGTSALLASFRVRDSRVRVVEQANQGLVKALNRGCGLVRGKYIARMDADDIALPDRFRQQVEFMESHAEAGVVGAGVEFMDAKGASLNIKSEIPCGNEEIQKVLIDTNVLWHPSVMMRRSIFESAGGYRKVTDAEDYDLWLRMAEVSELANLPGPLLRYRIHPGQVSARKRGQQILGALGAQTAAGLRRSGKPDPLDSVDEISKASLLAMGVTQRTLETALARGYLTWIRNLYRSGQYDFALEMFHVLRGSNFPLASTWIMADAHVWAAKVFWKQGRIGRSLLSGSRAIQIRPVILGRPVKEGARWSRGRLKVLLQGSPRVRPKIVPSENAY